jgi:iron(III) transport system ATP-binding protein
VLVIAAKGISKRFGIVAGLQAVSFELAQGGRLAIMGPSGSGKTTLLRLLAGLEAPDEGEIWIGGRVASGGAFVANPSSRGISMVFQRPALWPHMSVERNVAYGLRGASAEEAKERVEEILRRLSLLALRSRYPHELSGGEAQRTALARALAPALPTLLLDEPFSHLDTELADAAKEAVLVELRRWGTTLLMASHDADAGRSLCQEVLTLSEGRAVSIGMFDPERSARPRRSAEAREKEEPEG